MFRFLLFTIATLLVFKLHVFAQEEAIDEEGSLIPSLLLESVIRFNFEGIDRAISNGESIDVRNDQGWSAAMFAVANNDIDMLKFLDSKGIDFNNPNNDGETPLMLAAQTANREAVEVLLAANASPLITANDGTTAFDRASKSGRQIIGLLIAEAAAQHGLDSENLEAVLQAVRNGAYVNIRNSVGFTPVIEAAALNQVDYVRELLRYGADVNRVENDGWTALHFAANAGNLEIVQELLSAQADVNIRNNKGSTARDLALLNDHLEIAELLGHPSDSI